MVVDWLLDGDPAIRWQVLRDLEGAPPAAVASERARVACEGWGAKLLASQAADGRWGQAAWNRGWDSTMHVLWLLAHLGLDPKSPAAAAAIERVRAHVTWRGAGPPECDDHPFFAGELEPCINGQVAMAGAYFGQDVSPLIQRLLSEQLADGGWNCDAPHESTHSSFNTTICVLEALLQYERTGGRIPTEAARARGQDYLLERRLGLRRSTGEPIAADRKSGHAWRQFAFPGWWHYDVLRGLDYLAQAGATPDARGDEAVALAVSRRGADGRWPLDAAHAGTMPIDLGERVGQPSRWNTLRALRALRWYERR